MNSSHEKYYFPAVTMRIYQDPMRNNCYFCNVVVGRETDLCINRSTFVPGSLEFEVTLNGPGRSRQSQVTCLDFLSLK